jgi:hypothetical protein
MIKGKYAIEQIDTEKDKIRHPIAAEKHVIPKLCTSMIFCGKSGSGKSTLLANLLSRDVFYGNSRSFDAVFLISPTGTTDDIQKSLHLSPTHVITDLEKEAIPFLERLYTLQSQEIEKMGAAKAKKICLIFDDVVGNTRFMNSTIFVKCFVANRHANLTVMLCSQHWTRVPRVCRLQANTLYFFALSNSEIELLCEEFAPPGMKKTTFRVLVDVALKIPYSFLTIDMKQPWNRRFRRGLEEYFDLEFFKRSDEQY